MHIEIKSYHSGKPIHMARVRVDNDAPVIDGNLPGDIRQVVADAWERTKAELSFYEALRVEFRGAYWRATLVRS